MKRILTAAILIPLVFYLVIKAPMGLFISVCAIIAMLAQHEYFHIIKAYEVKPLSIVMYVIVVISFVLVGFTSMTHKWLENPGVFIVSYYFLYGLFISFFFVLTISMVNNNLKESLPSACMSWASLLYIAMPFFILIWMRGTYFGVFWVIYLMLVVWSGDIFAMYVGKLFGKHKLAPIISPGKTWEGTIASFFGSIAMGCVFYYAVATDMIKLLAPPLINVRMFTSKTIIIVAICSILTNIAAQIGDLVESMMKRGANIKDSGSLLPGHGGVLDRIDAMLFAIPVVFYFAVYTSQNIDF